MDPPPCVIASPDEYLWIVVCGAVSAFVMAFGIGANDVANAFATSVGSKSLKLWQAVVIAAIFEFLGAVLLGAQVTATISKGIADSSYYEERPDMLMIGMLCALVGAGLWVITASYLSMPVSTTHSIVGAIIGFSLVAAGPSSIDWKSVGLIVASWFASPILSGLLSGSLFFSVRRWILRSSESLSRSLIFFPILIAFTIFVNVFFITYKGAPGLSLDETPLWLGVTIALGVGFLIGLLAYFFFVPYMRRKLEQSKANGERLPLMQESTNYKIQDASAIDRERSTSDVEPLKKESSMRNFVSSSLDRLKGKNIIENNLKEENVKDIHDNAEKFDPDTEYMFTFAQVITAIFDSFAHGANDVANSIAPFAAIYAIYQENGYPEESPIPVWVLCLGGGGIVAGLALYGYKIIEAIGIKLAKITPSRGFSIELGSAFVVVVASKVGIPVSTTQCQVGSTVAIGILEGRSGINWGLLYRTFIGWGITLVFSGCVSAALFSFAVFSPRK